MAKIKLIMMNLFGGSSSSNRGSSLNPSNHYGSRSSNRGRDMSMQEFSNMGSMKMPDFPMKDFGMQDFGMEDFGMEDYRGMPSKNIKILIY
jgi:hypothetical protein